MVSPRNGRGRRLSSALPPSVGKRLSCAGVNAGSVMLIVSVLFLLWLMRSGLGVLGCLRECVVGVETVGVEVKARDGDAAQHVRAQALITQCPRQWRRHGQHRQ